MGEISNVWLVSFSNYEIKGFQWWEEKIKQNMRDKFKAYKSFGYHPHLIYNGKEEFDF